MGLIKKLIEVKEINIVTCYSGRDHLIDGMTKRTASCLGLKEVFYTGRRNPKEMNFVDLVVCDETPMDRLDSMDPEAPTRMEAGSNTSPNSFQQCNTLLTPVKQCRNYSARERNNIVLILYNAYIFQIALGLNIPVNTLCFTYPD